MLDRLHREGVSVAKSKYEELVKPYLKEIESWKRTGSTDEQIAKNLGIAKVTLYDYKNKHPELSERLKKGKEHAVADLKSELWELAHKHTLKTKKIYIRNNADGSESKFTEITEKEIDSSPIAINMLLKNIDRDGKWSDNPQGISLREQELELKRLEMELNNIGAIE